MTTLEQVRNLEGEALRTLEAADESALDAWRVTYLGRREGRLTAILRGLANLDVEQRRSVGAAANQARETLERAFEAKHDSARRRRLMEAMEAGVDVTLPARPVPRGRLHPVSQTMRDILQTFRSLGFRVSEGPEVEWERYNFDSLRIPADHPARDMWDTFWVDHVGDNGERVLLRTHTSPNQARIMERTSPPIRVVVPGRCYRFEATDAKHEWMMQQVEGLAIDEGITLADLKGTLYEFARQLFGQDRRIMFRHSYFPFVEPGVEMSMDCFVCGGAGGDCRTCGGDGWIEILGAGMVHPEMIDAAGYDSEVHTGFAFGMGVERVAMLRYGVDDIRNFYQNDLRFLRQF